MKCSKSLRNKKIIALKHSLHLCTATVNIHVLGFIIFDVNFVERKSLTGLAQSCAQLQPQNSPLLLQI